MNEMKSFAYLACEDIEDWNSIGILDTFDYDGACRFRRVYEDGVFFVYYHYSTFSLHRSIDKLCFVPDLFYTDHPENLLEDMVETANHLIFTRDLCISIVREDKDVNRRFLERMRDQIQGTEIYEVDDNLDVLYKVSCDLKRKVL